VPQLVLDFPDHVKCSALAAGSQLVSGRDFSSETVAGLLVFASCLLSICKIFCSCGARVNNFVPVWIFLSSIFGFRGWTHRPLHADFLIACAPDLFLRAHFVHPFLQGDLGPRTWVLFCPHTRFVLSHLCCRAASVRPSLDLAQRLSLIFICRSNPFCVSYCRSRCLVKASRAGSIFSLSAVPLGCAWSQDFPAQLRYVFWLYVLGLRIKSVRLPPCSFCSAHRLLWHSMGLVPGSHLRLHARFFWWSWILSHGHCS
jgi:hypothetical protein